MRWRRALWARLFLLAAVPGFLLAASPSAMAQAQEACPKALLDQIQESYQALRGFRGTFTQQDTQHDGSAVTAEGELAYLKPGRMRWTYHPPHEQLLVTDGGTVWLYDPILENVTIQPLKGMTQGTPLAFLLGVGNLQADFSCRAQTRKAPADELRYLELVPRKAIPTLKFMQLGVRMPDARILALVMVDKRDQARVVRFTELTQTADFPQGFFTFEVKEGMEVIRREEG